MSAPERPAGTPVESAQPGGSSAQPGGSSAQPRGRDTGELVMTALLLVLGIYLLVDAGDIAVPGTASNVGPRFFPYLVGGVVIATALGLGFRVLRGDHGPADESEDVDPTAGTDWRAVVVIGVAFLAHALLINVVGWPLAVTLMFGVVGWSLGARGIVRPLLAGGVASIVIWILFVKALNVALPGGTVLEWATSWF